MSLQRVKCRVWLRAHGLHVNVGLTGVFDYRTGDRSIFDIRYPEDVVWPAAVAFLGTSHDF